MPAHRSRTIIGDQPEQRDHGSNAINEINGITAGTTVKWLVCILAGSALGAGLGRADWPTWRGPHQDGVADDVGLISKWSPAGENLVWRAALGGRSSPVAVGGRGCATGVGGGGRRR